MSRPVLILTLEQAAAIEALRRDWRDGRPLEHAVIRLLQTFPVPRVWRANGPRTPTTSPPTGPETL